MKGFSAHFIAHQRPSPVILAFFRKTISAGKIAVMGYVETKRLYHSLPVMKRVNVFLIHVETKEELAAYAVEKLSAEKNSEVCDVKHQAV